MRDPFADKVVSCKTTHRRRLNQRILDRWITEVVPLLHQMDPEHGLQRANITSALATGWGMVGLDQIDEILPGHHSLHLGKKSLPLSAFPGRGLFVITVGACFRSAVAEMLATNEPSQPLPSQTNYRVDLTGYSELA